MIYSWSPLEENEYCVQVFYGFGGSVLKIGLLSYRHLLNISGTDYVVTSIHNINFQGDFHPKWFVVLKGKTKKPKLC